MTLILCCRQGARSCGSSRPCIPPDGGWVSTDVPISQMRRLRAQSIAGEPVVPETGWLPLGLGPHKEGAVVGGPQFWGQHSQTLVRDPGAAALGGPVPDHSYLPRSLGRLLAEVCLSELPPTGPGVLPAQPRGTCKGLCQVGPQGGKRFPQVFTVGAPRPQPTDRS